MHFTQFSRALTAYFIVTAVSITGIAAPNTANKTADLARAGTQTAVRSETKSALKTIASDFVKNVIVESTVGHATAKGVVWLSKTRMVAPIISYTNGVLEATGVGAAATATLLIGGALSAGTFFYGPIAAIKSVGTIQDQRTKEYYLRLWGQHLRQIQTKADVTELQQIFVEGAELAGTSYGNYVEKNKLNWCGKNGPNCKLNFNNIFVSPVADSRVISLKNFNVWEISADVIFPYRAEERQKKVFDIAVELLRMASDYDFDGMKRKIENDLMIRDDFDMFSKTRCNRDPAKTVMAYMILGKALPKEFIKICKASPKVYDINATDQSFPLYALQDIDMNKNTLEYRALPIPQLNYKTISRNSSEDKSNQNTCTMSTVVEKFPGDDLKKFFYEANVEAKNYFRSFVKLHGMNWCQRSGKESCSPRYEFMQLSDVSTVTPIDEMINSKNEIVWKIPFKMLCGYQSNMRHDYLDYVTLELLRKTPSPEHFEAVYKSAQELKNSSRFEGKLPCDESANTMLGMYMMNREVNLEYLGTLCQGRPLPPPSSFEERTYRNDSSLRFQNVVQEDYKEMPLFASCGPNEIQNLFLAELSRCETMSLVPLKSALNFYGDEVSRQTGNSKRLVGADKLLSGTEKMFLPMLAYAVTYNLAHRYSPASPRRVANVFMGISISALGNFYGPYKSAKLSYGLSRGAIKFVYASLASAAATEAVTQLTGVYFDLEKIFPQDILQKAFSGNLDAKRDLRNNLNGIFDLNSSGHMLDEQAFSNILYFLAKNNPAGYRYVQLVEQQKNPK